MGHGGAVTVTAERLTYAIMRGRAAMREMYTDRCHVTREAQPGDADYLPDEDRQLDPVTRQRPPQARVTVYRGPCRMQVKVDINSNVVTAVSGEREQTYLTGQMQVPVEAAELSLILEGIDLSDASRRKRWRPAKKASEAPTLPSADSLQVPGE